MHSSGRPRFTHLAQLGIVWSHLNLPTSISLLSIHRYQTTYLFYKAHMTAAFHFVCKSQSFRLGRRSVLEIGLESGLQKTCLTMPRLLDPEGDKRRTKECGLN